MTLATIPEICAMLDRREINKHQAVFLSMQRTDAGLCLECPNQADDESAYCETCREGM